MTDETFEALRRLLYVPDLEGVRIMRLEPGDVVLVEVEGRMPQDEADRVVHQLGEIWPENKVLVCDEGLRVRVARADLGDDDPDEDEDVEV